MTAATATMRFEPADGLSGELRPPPDKSISHRAALLGAMASEPVRIERFLQAADTESTLAAVRALGALVEVRGEEVIVRGTGLREAREPDARIDVGNAGTLLRILPGWLAAQEGRCFTLDGDASIRARPVDRIAEPARSRDHTERMLLRAGVAVHRHGRHVTVGNADELLLGHVRVPGDLSSAAFLIVAGVLVPGSRLLIADVGVNWTRSGFLRILRRMQGIVLGDLEEESGELVPEEPVSDLDVAHGALEGTTVDPEEVPPAIDELPLVALLGCFAEGETVVRGAQELRVKESDRIATVVEGLRALGAEIEATADGFAVRGTGGLRGGRIQARGDHRLAMMGAVAGLASREGVEVEGIAAASVSYPGFLQDLARLTG